MNQRRTISNKIIELKDDEIFVFGSNLKGSHGAGAALMAARKFGAVFGKGSGLQGKSYGIPTKDKNINTLPLSKIKPYVDKFIKYAEKHQDYIFLVTEIGCGLAGYSVPDIAPMFKEALNVKNIYLPERFINHLTNK